MTLMFFDSNTARCTLECLLLGICDIPVVPLPSARIGSGRRLRGNTYLVEGCGLEDVICVNWFARNRMYTPQEHATGTALYSKFLDKDYGLLSGQRKSAVFL